MFETVGGFVHCALWTQTLMLTSAQGLVYSLFRALSWPTLQANILGVCTLGFWFKIYYVKFCLVAEVTHNQSKFCETPPIKCHICQHWVEHIMNKKEFNHNVHHLRDNVRHDYFMIKYLLYIFQRLFFPSSSLHFPGTWIGLNMFQKFWRI